MKRLLAVLFAFIVVFSSCLPLIQPDTMSDSSGNLDILRDVDIDGTLTLIDPVWDDVAVPMAQVRMPAANSPTLRSYRQSQVPAFGPTEVDVIYFSAQLPHSYKEGTDIEFHIHVAYPDAMAGESTWYFSYSWANIGDAFPVPSETTLLHVVSPTVSDAHRIVQVVPVISGVGKTISSVLLCSIQRIGNDGDDTYPSEIYLVSGDLHFRKDTIGSRQQLVK